MFKKVLISAAMAAILLFCCEVEAGTSEWTDCNDGEWGDPCNWWPIGVPNDNTFDVVINCPNGVEVRLTDNYTINKLDCYGQVDLEGWDGWHRLTLNHADGLKNFGYLEIEEIGIIGNVTNWAMLELCDMDIEGDLNNLSGAWMGVEYETWVEGTLQNGGTIEIDLMSELVVEGVFWNYSSGTILIYGGECGADEQMLYNYGVIRGVGVLYGGQDVQNLDQGQIIASGGSLVVSCEGSLINTSTGLLRNEPLASLQIKPWLHRLHRLHTEPEDVNNYGDIEVNAGGGVAFDCNLVNEANGIIRLLGGTLAARNITHSAGAMLYGFGTITTNELLLESGTDPEFTGPTNIVGNLKVANGATLIISAGLTLITGHTTNNGTILLAGGSVIFEGGYSGSGKVIDAALPNGIIIDNGDEGTSSTGLWKVSGVSGFYDANSLYNSTNGNSYSFEAWVLGNREVSLWWTAHPGRSTAVPVKIYDGESLLDTVIVNQQNNGGKWNPLGYYTFTDEAEVRIVSPGSGVAVADAVRFGPSNEIVIDNGDEGTSSTGTWKVSNLAGFYGENSLYNSKSGDSYSFEAPILGTCEISLWWTAHANRSTNVTVEIYDGGDLLDTVTVNQTTNGGQWNVLVGGPYTFSYGAKVKIICPGDGNNAVADAVKFAPL